MALLASPAHAQPVAVPMPVAPTTTTAAVPAKLPAARTAPPIQTGGRITPSSFGYDSRPRAAHGLDSLLAALPNPSARSAGLTPNVPWGHPQIPGVGSSGIVGRQSVAAPSLTQSSPAMPRPRLVLAVHAILALSAVTAEHARGVLLRRRPVR